MGNSSPPFLYSRPEAYRFKGPTDRPFNPKAVTKASWTRPVPKPKPDGPLINFNRHPDSYSNIPDGKSRWTPMGPRTRTKVFWGRKIQLGLRVLALLGALGSLFCAIVIKNVPSRIIWIVRAGPSVAILHTIYAIYHLRRSPVTRPPGSQASYMIFAASLDLGLVPFYVFAAYLGYEQYTSSAYSWETLLSSDVDVITKIAQSTFYLSVINGGLHLVSLVISGFLFNIFRQITKLPPDLNPLEDNLTARPHKRTKSEIAEKHTSSSTLDSTTPSMAEPLIGPPRTVPFMHTRAQSSEDNSARFSTDISNELRNSQTSIPQMPFTHRADTLEDMDYDIPMHDTDVVTRPTSSIPRTPVREPSPELPSRSQCVSPASENWVAYSSRSTTPVQDAQNEASPAREPSSVYSRAETPASTNGVVDWMTLAQRYEWEISEPISEDIRGEYESLAMHEFYGNDDDAHNVRKSGLYDHDEHDIGDNRIQIYHDHVDSDAESDTNTLRVNPLGLNPPTPQPVLNVVDDTKKSPNRMILSDIPNLFPTPSLRVPPLDSPAKSGRFYGDLDGNSGLNVTRAVSGPEESKPGRKKSKLMKRKSLKQNTYGALKQQEDEDIKEKAYDAVEPVDPAVTERDRTGRVISNSGADFNRPVSSDSSLSYGNYIAGLGVGRRRDVSGKMAEEGRGGISKSGNDASIPIRAAGWARFAGL
ncbi:hypothetical protein P175DRAFT_0503054 [Aspergillus ochraceoroseus IBT 24754]|uniref:Uncharacterized protein n=3 Tax=Aspergillus subgen. Nidulantes TaxID=2720870 RepID=A0A0F8XK66_9EURO|nr:uncharacterized protein P175DRAFT_0503054 [Aspergillus ochraceoroseus IBT 24754]KKK23947.1 hypothetical protein ARAM_003425 [Aspergillus rambellii]PTU19519.1 hypothetical protein P175DRAFT_0503054 [Aspergillus ochraceoroseus IBT 24754]